MAYEGPRAAPTKYPNNPNKLSPEPTSPHPVPAVYLTLKTNEPRDEQIARVTDVPGHDATLFAARLYLKLLMRGRRRRSVVQLVALKAALPQLGRTLGRLPLGAALLGPASGAATFAASPFPEGFVASEPGAFTFGVTMPPVPMPW